MAGSQGPPAHQRGLEAQQPAELLPQGADGLGLRPGWRAGHEARFRQPAVEQLPVDLLRGEADGDEGEPPREGERQAEQVRPVIRVHGGDQPPTGVHDVLVAAPRPGGDPPGRPRLRGGQDAQRGHAHPVGEVDPLAREYGEELAEGLVDLGPVDLIDDQPVTQAHRAEEQARPELQPLPARGDVPADRIERGPIGGGRRAGVAGGEPLLPGEFREGVGQLGLARTRLAQEEDVLAGVEGGGDLRVDGRPEPQAALSLDVTRQLIRVDAERVNHPFLEHRQVLPGGKEFDLRVAQVRRTGG